MKYELALIWPKCSASGNLFFINTVLCILTTSSILVDNAQINIYFLCLPLSLVLVIEVHKWHQEVQNLRNGLRGLI